MMTPAQALAGGGSTTLTLTWYDQSGTPTDVGPVTIGVVDGNGDTVVASGTATVNNGGGTYTYTLADQSNPDHLTVTWTDSDTGDTRVHRLEVVGAWLFTEAQARQFRAKADAAAKDKPLASETEYPDSVIAEERARILGDLERWTGRGWVPRYCRLELAGTGDYDLPLVYGLARTADGYILDRPGRLWDIGQILSVTVGGSSVAIGNVKVDGSALVRTDAAWTKATRSDPLNVVVEYVYGPPYAVDGVDRIALSLLVDRLVPSPFPDRTLSATTEFGTVRYVQPGGPQNNVSRLPEVNEWVRAHDVKVDVG